MISQQEIFILMALQMNFGNHLTVAGKVVVIRDF